MVPVAGAAGHRPLHCDVCAGGTVSDFDDEFEPDFLDHTDRRTEHDIDDAEHAQQASRAHRDRVLAAAIEAMKRISK